jgi:arabinose-5-phosphate isomerase
MIDEIKKLLELEAQAVLNIPVNNSYEKAVGLLYAHVHVKKGKIVASGMGKAGQIALNMSTTFSSTGSPAVFIHPSEAQHGDLGILQENDIMLLVSNSAKTREVIELVELANKYNSRIPFILITGYPKGDLAQKAAVTIATGMPKEVCALGLTPTTSTTTMTVIGDILVVLLMKKIGFTSEQYAHLHHGGYLGQKSREQAGNKNIG